MLPYYMSRISYAESNGSQYFGISEYITSNLNLKIEFAFTNTSGNQAILGATETGKQSWVGHNGSNFVVRWGEGEIYYPKSVDTEWHTFEVRDGYLFFDEINIGISGNNFSTRSLLYFFRQNCPLGLNIEYPARARIKSIIVENAIIFEGDRYSIIPVIAAYANGTRVQFYGYTDYTGISYNSTGGTFISGDLVYTIDSNVYPINAGNVLGTKIYDSGDLVLLDAIPANGFVFDKWQLNGYTRLNYIKSTGIQYINTGIPIRSDDFIIQATFKYEGFSSSMQSLFGVSDNNRHFFFGADDSNGWGVQIGGENTEKYFLDNLDTNWHTIRLDTKEGKLFFDQKILDVTSSTIPINNNLYMFAENNNGVVSQHAHIYVSDFKVMQYTNNTGYKYIRDFIPVICHQDGVCGLFDLVEMKFYKDGTYPYNPTFYNFIGGDVYAS